MLQAIETRYAGCRFRSRLEARWAVFFDWLGVEWEYEPQGFQVPKGGRWGPMANYLPDFWLPTEKIWIEVKGSLPKDQLLVLIGATFDGSGLPATPAGGELDDCPAMRGGGNPFNNRNGPRLLILGPIPDPTARGQHHHHVLCHHKGDIIVGHAAWHPGIFLSYDYSNQIIASDSDEFWYPKCQLTSTCTFSWRNDPDLSSHCDSVVGNAYRAARSARFEHGESG